MNIENWKEQLKKPSGNLTTNQAMPAFLINKLLEENVSLKDKLKFSEVDFPKHKGLLNEIVGLDILAGLQSLSIKNCLTLFRAIRFPTYKRLYEAIYNHGFAILNYEQERILDLYKNENYINQRGQIKNNPLFWTQPQERVVKGLPVFCLANDTLQIHRAFRADDDLVIMVAIHIPHELLEKRKIRLVANPAIDLDYDNDERDFEIRDFVKANGAYNIDFKALRVRGIDLHEMYTNDLPWDIEEAKKIGVEQVFFLLNIRKITDYSKIKELKETTELLKSNAYFLHGFFGDQNIFGRRSSKYLPYKCQKLSKNE